MKKQERDGSNTYRRSLQCIIQHRISTTKPMKSIIELLASSCGIKGEEPNIALAKEIASNNDRSAVKELVENLKNKDKNIQSDCIKALYETGYIKPELIADYCSEFLELLTSKNNRLVWGGMIAISTIADLKPKEIFKSLNLIMETVDKGSVITIDAGIEILSKLNKSESLFNTTDPLLLDQLWKCPIKQLPMYVEKALKSINIKNKEAYMNLIDRRRIECEKKSQIKRLDNSLKKISNIR